MANWPSYTFELIGDYGGISEIADILIHQTHDKYLEWHDYMDTNDVTLKVSGRTPWGVKNFEKIEDVIEKNGISARFIQGDDHNPATIGKWSRGECVSAIPYCEDDEIEEIWDKDWETIVKNHYVHYI